MKYRFFWTSFLLLAVFGTSAADPPEEGRLLFSTRCAGCHNVNKVLTGPALAGVEKRHEMAWIVNFVRSSKRLIQAGDTAARRIYDQFNRVSMPDHPDLSDDQITAIVTYIQSASKELSAKAPFSKPGKRIPPYRPVPIRNYGLYLAYLGVVLVLSIVLVFFVRVKMIERQKTDANHKLP